MGDTITTTTTTLPPKPTTTTTTKPQHRRRRKPRWTPVPKSQKKSTTQQAEKLVWYQRPDTLVTYTQRLNTLTTQQWLEDWNIRHDAFPIILSIPFVKYVDTEWLRILKDIAQRHLKYGIHLVCVDTVKEVTSIENDTVIYKSFPAVVPPDSATRYSGCVLPFRIILPTLTRQNTLGTEGGSPLLKYVPLWQDKKPSIKQQSTIKEDNDDADKTVNDNDNDDDDDKTVDDVNSDTERANTEGFQSSQRMSGDAE